MVDGLAFPVHWPLKVLNNTNQQIHPFTHKVPAVQEQLGVRYLTQGHFNMQLGGAGIQPSDLSDF